MARPRIIEAEQAQRVAPAAPPVAADEQGDSSGLVTVKTRLPLHLHIALSSLADRNDRSIAAELRAAVYAHVEAAARGRR